MARIAASAAGGFSAPGFGDAGPYLFAAHELVHEGRYPDRTEPFFFRAPAYPFFLVAATLGNTDRIALAKIANAALGSAAAVLLALLSARIFRRRRLALATGAVAALFPGFVQLSIGVQSEPLFLVFLLGSGLCLLIAFDWSAPGPAWAAGSALGLAALTRPSALVLAPLLAAPFFVRRPPPGRGPGLAARALLAFLLTLSPWMLRNALRFHEFIAISDAGGVSFYAGNSAWTRSFYRIDSRAQYETWLADFDRDLRARLARIEAEGAVSPGRRSAAFARMGMDEIRADPAGSLGLLARKAWHWLRPYPTPWFWPPAIVVGIGILYGALSVFAVRGFVLCPRRGVTAFCLAVLGISMAVHVALQVVWRYRVPYWDPILVLYGVFGAERR